MSTAPFNDHFSSHAADYARARPRYPDALFRFLAERAAARERAWDCATGNGQAARSLAAHFARVVATDASAAQIRAATPRQGVEFRVASAESSGLDDASVDLLCVAQALHWFDLERFFAEAGRVLKPGGLLVAWCYGGCLVDDACDRLVQGLYRALDEYWPPQRRLVEDAYRGIELPGRAVACPPFAMHAWWSAGDMLDYLRTWSATTRCAAATGGDPLQRIAGALQDAWGGARRRVSWPLTVKASRM
ncbi:MAG TPA: class I SAM-dependent methyltransferase [Woeseiaceae bacterium]|nr:class I SAM-dependent methyltransferase [Woeseiaceae bacterium]